MKATGVVRKIDHLGRIVIPKEIRKTLRIKDGESLEIFVESDTILLKKISSLEGLQTVSDGFVDIIASLLEKNICITDMDEVVACNKGIMSSYLNQELTSEYLEILQKREVYVASNPSNVPIVSSCESAFYYMLVPIVVQGDLLGSIFLFSEDNEIQEKDKTLIKFILKYLEKNLEG